MSNLQFEATVEQKAIIQRLKSFYGRNIDQMPLLLAEGRNPLTPKFVMTERVKGKNAIDRQQLRDNYVDTSAISFADPSGTGEVIIALSKDPVVEQLVYSLNPKTKISDGSVVAEKDVYETIKQQEVKVIDATTANNLRGNPYSELKAREGIWNYLAEGDSKLVKSHLGLTGGKMENKMGIYLHANKGWRLVCLDSVGVNSGDAGSSGDIGSNYGRLVGVSDGVAGTEGASAKNLAQPKIIAPTLEQVLAIHTSRTLNDVQKDAAFANLYRQ